MSEKESAKPSGKWSDREKLALFMSIIAASGTVNWSNVALPEGRSKMACWHIYSAAMKEAQTIPLADKKSPPKKKTTTTATEGAKGKRKRAAGGGEGGEDVDEEAGEIGMAKGKKVKKEEEGEGLKESVEAL